MLDVYDEFANIGLIPKFEKLITTIKSRREFQQVLSYKQNHN